MHHALDAKEYSHSIYSGVHGKVYHIYTHSMRPSQDSLDSSYD